MPSDRLLATLKCPECEAWLEQFVNFSGCPNGHGAMRKPLSEGELGIIAARIFPAAEKVQLMDAEGRKQRVSRYRIDGQIYVCSHSISGGRALEIKTHSRRRFDRLWPGGVIAMSEHLSRLFGVFLPAKEANMSWLGPESATRRCPHCKKNLSDGGFSVRWHQSARNWRDWKLVIECDSCLRVVGPVARANLPEDKSLIPPKPDLIRQKEMFDDAGGPSPQRDHYLA